MNITVDDNIKLKLFNAEHAISFFNSIHLENAAEDDQRRLLQSKYKTLEKLLLRINDAIENKFKKDGTPDFFIFFENKIVGVFEFHPLSNDDFVEVGFWLFLEFRGLGILSRVFPEMIKYAKSNFSKGKMLATTSIENVSAQKLLERVSFIKVDETENVLSSGAIEREFTYILQLNHQ